MFRATACLAALALAASISLAFAQSDPAVCQPIKDSAARLKCYDDATKSDWPNTLIWSGDGKQMLPPFNTSGPWTLHWSTTSTDGLTLFVYNTPPSGDVGSFTDDPSSNSAGASQSYETTTGTIYMKVDGDDPWKIWVTPSH